MEEKTILCVRRVTSVIQLGGKPQGLPFTFSIPPFKYSFPVPHLRTFPHIKGYRDEVDLPFF